MKFALKLIAASLVLAAAGQASAATADSNTNGNIGGGELFLSVWDSTAQTSYIRDLGIRMNDFLPAAGLGLTTGLTNNQDKTSTGALISAGTVAPYSGAGVHNIAFGGAPTIAAGNPTTAGYQLNFAADPLLASFYGNTLSTNLQWMVGVADGTGTTALGTKRVLTTSNGAVAASNGTLAVFGNTAAYISVNNSKPTMPAGFNTNGSATASVAGGDTTAYFDNLHVGTWGGSSPFSNLAAVGTSQKFWLLESSSGIASAAATVVDYSTASTDATWLLDANGNLSYTVAAVPEADTWAMFAAGLLAVGAIARRRLQS